MKKGNYSVEENLVRKAQNLVSGNSGNSDQNFLLFITSLKDLSLKAINGKGIMYCEQYLKRKPSSRGNHFEYLVHPEDYSRFSTFTKTGEQLEYAEEYFLHTRVKSPYGYWKSFTFTHRLYRGIKEGEGQYLISIGKAEDKEKFSYGNTSSYNFEAEKVFQESLNKYKQVLSSLDQGFVIGDMIYDLQQRPFDYLFLETNPAFEAHTNAIDPAGKTMKEFFRIHEEHWIEKLAEVAQTGEAVRFEQYTRFNKKWFDIYSFPVTAEKNKKVGVLFSDITERKIAEEKLRKVNATLEEQVKERTADLKENHDLLQMVFDTVNQGIFLLKPVFSGHSDIVDFEYVRVNKKITRYYNQGELVGKSFLELNPQAPKTGALDIFKHTMTTGESKDFEVNLHRDGKDNWFKITTRRQKGLLINSLENITQRKLRAQDLRENIRFKKQLIKTTPDLILIFNLYDEKIRFMNRDLTDDPALTKENLLGKSLEDIVPLIHPQDRKKAIDFHEAIIAGADKDIVELEFRLRTRDRSWGSFNARGKIFMRNKKGNVYEYIILLRNVQEQKLVQKALIHAEKLSIKGEIARTIAHELRNPIASIGMSADILDKMIIKNQMKGLNNYTDIIKRSSTTLNNLVTELLSSSNYSAPVFEKCCLARVTNKALSNAKDRIYLTGIKVIKKYRSPYYINADEEKLKIALLNIIVNASEAMLPNEGVLVLTIKKKKDDFQLSIQDNGCGMEQQELERLFESFYTQKPGGMGIGLTSVKNILDDHGAAIEVESSPNAGTTFNLSFPCHEDVSGK